MRMESAMSLTLMAQQKSILKSRRWRYGEGLRERLMVLFGAIGNRTLSRIVSRTLIFLSLVLAPAMSNADYYIRGEGKGQPFCEKILATLNKTKPTNDSRPCVSELVLKMPGVSDPPWEKLDLSKHEALARDIYLVNTVGLSQFFAEQKSTVPGYWPTPEQIEKTMKLLRRDGELFAFRSPPDSDKWVVTLRYPYGMCGRPWRPDIKWSESAWVTDDLKQPLPPQYGYARRPLLYRGRLYFAHFDGMDGGADLYIPRSTGGLARICSIQFSDGLNSKGQRK